MPNPSDTIIDQTATPVSGSDDRSPLDRLTGTTAEDRKAFFNSAQETLSGAVTTAIDAVKGNPKTAAAIAAGATAAVAGAAYGATKLAKGSVKTPSKPRTRTTARRTPAKKTPAKA